jgi:hypothetical protein
MGPRLSDPAGTGAPRAALERRLRAERRAAACGVGVATAVVATAAAAFLLEGVARLRWFPELRTAEAACAAAALVAGAFRSWRAARRAPAWEATADARTDDPGVFAAARAADASASRWAPLLSERADAAAARLLILPRAPIDRKRAFAATKYVAAAALSALSPGRVGPPDALPDDVGAALRADAERLVELAANADPARKDALRAAADRLRGSTPRAADAAAAAEILRPLKPGALVEALLRAAREAPALAPFADALARRDARAAERAAAALRAAVAADPRLRAALAEALRAGGAAAGGDAARETLRRAAEAFAAGDGAGAVDALARAVAAAQSAEREVRDLLVRFDAVAEGPGGAGRTAAGADAAAPRATPSTGPAALTFPPGAALLAAPGSAEETVLRRYFATDR